jgi:hypothetical protein
VPLLHHRNSGEQKTNTVIAETAVPMPRGMAYKE